MHLMQAYQRLPITFSRGQGDRLWDTNNIEYIDAISGIGVTNLGHSHPVISATIIDQASTLLHTSNLSEIHWQAFLGERLCDLSGMDNAFICNSGCEANEVALKLARVYGSKKGIAKPMVIVMENAFHGRTFATNSASSNLSNKTGFEYEDLISGFIRVPFNDLDAIRTLADHRNDIVAILVEPIQGEGGIRVFEPGYLKGLRTICNDFDWLLMLDEVQTGIGRTGKWFAYQHENIIPDVVTLAKALGNGVPIGACLAKGSAAKLLIPGSYGSTFGGNPFASRVASVVLEVIESERLVQKAEHLGTHMLKTLERNLEGIDIVNRVRGLGLMLGVELKTPHKSLMALALEKERLCVNVTREKVIRLLPSLISSEHTIDTIATKITNLVLGAHAMSLFNIGQAAKASGISTKMIRHYESVGLLAAASRTFSGYRQYSEKDIHTLSFIRHSRDLGFSIKQIEELLSMWQDPHRPSSKVKELASAHVEALNQKIQSLMLIKSELQKLVHCCHGDDRPECPILDQLALNQ